MGPFLQAPEGLPTACEAQKGSSVSPWSETSSIESLSCTSVGSEDSVTFHTGYAELECVACNCYMCGIEFRGVVEPRKGSEFPFVFMADPTGHCWILEERSIPVLTLSFSSSRDMKQFHALLDTTLMRRSSLWWSSECWAGRPRSSPSCDDEGPGLCAMLVAVHAPGGLDSGLWSDDTVLREVRRILGCEDDGVYRRLFADVRSDAVLELVPISKWLSWDMERGEVLSRVPSYIMEPKVAFG